MDPAVLPSSAEIANLQIDEKFVVGCEAKITYNVNIYSGVHI